jgi:hypothetical protein
VTHLARQLLDSGLTRFSEREQRVIVHVAKRSQLARNVDTVLAEQQTLGSALPIGWPGSEAPGRS